MSGEGGIVDGPFGTYQYPNLDDVSLDEARRIFALHFAYMISPGQPSSAGDLLTSAAAINAWLAKDELPAPPSRKLAAVKG
ncbi:MAG: hypothetical protein WC869_11720 [Phycisphaerae bacterium]|jgi:hypothetical protein